MAFDRQLDAGHGGDFRRVAGRGEAQFLAGDEAAGGLHALTLPLSTRMPVTSQFWMMSTPRASAPRA
jgi:hypothetical protein